MKFCNIVDWDIFANTCILKSPIIIGGQLVQLHYTCIINYYKWTILC